MNNTQLLILIAILAALYLYWKSQQPAIKSKKQPESETFWDAQDFELTSEEEDNNLPTEQQNWFTDQRWLSDQEIDWALAQIKQEWIKANSSEPTPPSNPNTIWCPPASFVPTPFFKILESTQFMFLANVSQSDKDASIAFPVLLSELTDDRQELVFIPVNNPDYHWSLLVYEVKSKKFHHYDTLRNGNKNYVEPLIQELLQQIHQTQQVNLDHYLIYKNDIRQENTSLCGVAVIALAERLIQNGINANLTNLHQNFESERKRWRNKLINHYAQQG